MINYVIKKIYKREDIFNDVIRGELARGKWGTWEGRRKVEINFNHAPNCSSTQMIKLVNSSSVPNLVPK